MHAPEHEALIQAVVVGERSAQDPDVVRRCEECAACAARLAHMARVADALDAEAREELAIVALAERLEHAPGAERIASFDWRAHSSPRRSKRIRRGGLAAIAAAALVVVFVWNAQRDDPPADLDPRVLLGPAEILLEPFDGFDDDLVLRYHAGVDIAADVALWELVVTDDGDFHAVHVTSEGAWSDPATVRGFPARITVTVSALNASGREIARSVPVTGSRAR